MANSRRDFLKKSAIAVVAAGIPIQLSADVFARSDGNPASGFAIPTKSLDDPLMYLTRSSFEAYINSDFVVRANGISSELRLIKVNSKGSTPAASKSRQAAVTMVRESESENQ